MKTIPIPEGILKKHGLTTQREWKSLKRKQFLAIQKAFDEYLIGCVYTPAYYTGELQQLHDLIESIQEAQSIKRWGR